MHQQLQTVLSGQSSAITIEGSSAVLDLAPFIDSAKQHLVDSGFAAAARIPEIHPTVELFPASYLVRAQTAYRILDTAATWLPWLALLTLVGGVLLARRRRRAVMAIGLGVMGVMVLLAVALLVTRGLLVGSVAEQAAPAAVIFDTLVRFLRIALRTIFVVGLIIALGAFLVGPAPTAVRLRGALSRMIDRLRRGGVSGTAGRARRPLSARAPSCAAHGAGLAGWARGRLPRPAERRRHPRRRPDAGGAARCRRVPQPALFARRSGRSRRWPTAIRSPP